MPGTKDFFISYNHNDQVWAEWIADVLENASCSVVIQAWDFLPGSNFVLEMQRATTECNKTIAVLSPDYLASLFTQAEWAIAFSVDPSGANRKLIPIRVRMCEPPGLLRTIVHCDLLGLAEDAAKSAVLRAVSTDRVRPERPIFPIPKLETGSPPPVNPPIPYGTSYPGPGSQVSLKSVPESVSAAAELLGLVKTTRTAFEAQSRLRDNLVHQIMERLVLSPFGLKYETFLTEHASALTTSEKRTFQIIRGFTESVLFEYNSKTLRLIQDNPSLVKASNLVSVLKDHLSLWLAKYKAVFIGDPTISLLYVGVEEGVYYPGYVEQELWRYLKSQNEVDDLLGSEEPPQTNYREGAPVDNWWHSQLKRWKKKIFSEIEAKLTATSDDISITMDLQLARIISDLWYPSCMYVKHDVNIIDILSAVDFTLSFLDRGYILAYFDRTLESEESTTVEKVMVEVSQRDSRPSASDFRFKDVLPFIPRLSRLNYILPTSSNLDLLWRETRPKLIAFGAVYFSQ